MTGTIHDSILPFIRISERTNSDLYWYDGNTDGWVQDERETFEVGRDESRVEAANKFIETHPWFFPYCIKWIPVFSSKGLKEYFSDPRQIQLAEILDADIENLHAMKDRPEIFSGLLEDLIIIRRELSHTHFERDDDHKKLRGKAYAALYSSMEHTIYYGSKTTDSELLHEMDHKLTDKRRIEEYSLPHYVFEGGRMHYVVKEPGIPYPYNARHSYSFELDFVSEKKGRKELLYDHYYFREPMYAMMAFGVEICTTEKTRRAAIANEVRAFTTQSRYVLYKLRITKEEINRLDKEKHRNKDLLLSVMQRVVYRFKKYGQGKQIGYLQLLSYYFGMGGRNFDEDLVDFVKMRYTNAGVHNIVDQKGCANKIESTRWKAIKYITYSELLRDLESLQKSVINKIVDGLTILFGTLP